MYLDTTAKYIQAVLTEASVTQPCDIVCSYEDITASTFQIIANDLSSNGTTPVTIVPAPVSGVARRVKSIDFFNKDTVQHGVSIQYVSGAGTRVLWSGILAADQILQYANGIWEVGAGVALNAQTQFGTGVDGNVTVTAPLAIVRDMYYNNLTIQSGAVITGQFRIFVAGTLDISAAPTGAFTANGHAAVVNAGGSTIPVGSVGVSSAGVSGQTTASNGNGATQQALYNGGTSGVGGASSGHTGGTVLTTISKIPKFWTGSAIGLDQTLQPTPTAIAGGFGGAGGACDVTANSGGGGGGGGVLIISAATIYRGSNTNVGIFQTIGGAGGTATFTTGSGGGGGGGGGGWVLIIYGALTGTPITGAVDVSGGASGAGAGTGGLGGGSGSSGNLALLSAVTGVYSTTTSIAGSISGTAAATSTNVKQYTL